MKKPLNNLKYKRKIMPREIDFLGERSSFCKRVGAELSRYAGYEHRCKRIEEAQKRLDDLKQELAQDYQCLSKLNERLSFAKTRSKISLNEIDREMGPTTVKGTASKIAAILQGEVHEYDEGEARPDLFWDFGAAITQVTHGTQSNRMENRLGKHIAARIEINSKRKYPKGRGLYKTTAEYEVEATGEEVFDNNLRRIVGWHVEDFHRGLIHTLALTYKVRLNQQGKAEADNHAVLSAMDYCMLNGQRPSEILQNQLWYEALSAESIEDRKKEFEEVDQDVRDQADAKRKSDLVRNLSVPPQNVIDDDLRLTQGQLDRCFKLLRKPAIDAHARIEVLGIAKRLISLEIDQVLQGLKIPPSTAPIP